jgi:hypothetical protein
MIKKITESIAEFKNLVTFDLETSVDLLLY